MQIRFPAGFRRFKRLFYLCALFSLCFMQAFSQNDNCINATSVAITGGGYDLGVFTSASSDISTATVEAGEVFAPAILVAGQTQKSVWYKFTITANRSVRVTLAQNGSAIQAGDVGFSVYKTNICSPTLNQISTKLTPIGLFGSTFHPCVEPGDYMVQVSSKAAANGPVFIQVEVNDPGAIYDHQAGAYDFGTLAPGVKSIVYQVDCHTIDSAAETCNALENFTQYTKSTWHVFKTPAYFDYITFFLAQQVVPSTDKFGYNLYKGDVRISPYTTLPLIDGCDSLMTDTYYAGYKIYRCEELDRNETYSIQLFFKQDFIDNINVALTVTGTAPTQAPEPILANIPAPSNALGTLPYSTTGASTTAYDQLACNSKMDLHPCDPSIPATGIFYNGLRYNLSTFFTFSLSTTSTLNMYAYGSCGPHPLVRLFQQGLTANCGDLDTSNLVAQAIYGFSDLRCLPAGDYTVQVLGRDSTDMFLGWQSFSSLYTTTTQPCYLINLGQKFTLTLTVRDINEGNQFGLQSPGAFDTIHAVNNIMTPMVNGVIYTSNTDTIGCLNTILPADTSCLPANSKGVYRQMIVPDSGIVVIGAPYGFYNKLYFGNADALATAQSISTYPDRIAGLIPYTTCFTYECNFNVCVVPGTYTHLTFAGETQIGQTVQNSFQFRTLETTHDKPANAEEIGTLNPGGSLTSAVDYFSCRDNAVPINGYQPCMISGDTATKAIYRQFYLSGPATLTLHGFHLGVCSYTYGAPMTLFKGRATDGIAGLTAITNTNFQCSNYASSVSSCDVFEPGWYTIVSYGSGPNYEDPFQNIQQSGYSSYVAQSNQVTITAVAECPGPKYNRPYKAAIDTITHAPFLIEWAPRAGHTSAYPKTDTTYILYKESFNCTVDTPFSAHPIPECVSTANKVAYYVFKTTQPAYVQVDTKGYWGAVYLGDARSDSALFDSSRLIQPCLYANGAMQLCELPPGTYTLALFANQSNNCSSVEPTIYIDKLGTSRFDFANNAYDFGVIPPDSLYYPGKPGDVNPLDAGRRPSSDIFYCRTGASPTDPNEMSCATAYNPNVYNGSINVHDDQTTTGSIARRNLWYSFVVKEGGTVRVQALGTTPGKSYNPRFAVYRSNVDANIPFSTIVSTGQVDSTVAQGLTYIVNNYGYPYCIAYNNEVSFYREPCAATLQRYYVVVENPNIYPYDYSGLQPNNQVDILIQVDSVNTIAPKFDFYSQANNIGTNIGPGTYSGEQDNYTCATRSTPDPAYSYTCNKTLWYKFSTNVTGNVRMQLIVNNNLASTYYNYYNFLLLRETIPGDSTSTGLQIINNTGNYIYDNTTASYWGQECISPGTYYIMLTGCDMLGQYVYPQIKIIEQAGDFCSAPVNAPLNGAGTSVSSVIIDCHTIGTDYGEFNPMLTCPDGAIKENYKTSWFKINIGGTDTLDVTTFLTENTNANPADIKYRLMNGNCGAMQERSCVQDAQTQDTYKCLAPGEYFIQVFVPVIKNGVKVTGTIDLNMIAVVHVDTCAPVPDCLVNATFQTQFDCTTSEAVTFINYSTFGSSVDYNWDFGYNGITSAEVSPHFSYPALTTSATYNVMLTVQNNSCTGVNQSTYNGTITIPPRPGVDLGPDRNLCTGGTTLLDATSHSGSTYQWQDGSTGPAFTVTAPGRANYNVKVTYNGCSAWDTINVNINPVTPRIENVIWCSGDPIQLNSARGLGESYTWSNGATTASIFVNVPGIYWNDIRLNGCTIRDSFFVGNIIEPLGNDGGVCFGTQPFVLNATTTGATSYTWQGGTTGATFTAPGPGLYWVDITVANCTLRDTILLSNIQASVVSNITAICSGQTFTLPSGAVINTSGAYSDTLQTPDGCDSLISNITLQVQNFTSPVINATICPGQNYNLPWGGTANATGTYRDTLHYVSGCDSIRKTVNLVVQIASASTTAVNICAGQTFTTPWGAVISTAGTFRDTLHYVSGCDSLRRSINVTLQSPATVTNTAIICFGDSYTLPWGTNVNASGIYYDTLHYITGCDSIRRSVNVLVQAPASISTNAVICFGQSYTLPWGPVVNTAGIYRDTLHYITGCDSIRRAVDLTVQSAASLTTDPVICAGQSYTLPWGSVVSTAGIYRDTLHYITGCDSLRRTVNLTVQFPAATAANANICLGDNYTLPWGAVVNTAGTYRDTLHYVTGCDSLRRTVILSVQEPAYVTTNPVICQGQTYTLPWGPVVNTSGTYLDTLHYATGCDSVRRAVNLLVQQPSANIQNINICSGATHTLPWGQVINAPGTYLDTLHYITGCDSLRRTVNVTMQSPVAQNANVTICAGQSYTLPWGAVANATGIYRDTLHYVTGCDSVHRAVNLLVQAPAPRIMDVTICEGITYTLPSGTIVNTTGAYLDTLYYNITGCDSLHRRINLTVTPAPVSSIAASICSDQRYTLPWGPSVNTSGIYRDTAVNNLGCYTLIREVVLTVKPKPLVNLFKANDINCILGTAKLRATGAAGYQWTPAATLDDPYIAEPTASPVTNTTYVVVSTASNGCKSKDSIRVEVSSTDPDEGYLVPSAFTPNGDGKNDCFGVPYWGNVSGFNMQVYSRWGDKVFESTDPKKCWDGLIKGVEQNTAAYIYQITATGRCGPVYRKGTVILIR